jgi:hypothetical protein
VIETRDSGGERGTARIERKDGHGRAARRRWEHHEADHGKRRRVQTMGIHEVKTAARSPWQNSYVELLIGTLRRECLDHVVVLNETHLRHLLRDYLTYDHRCRTHLSLEKDTPEPRPVEHPDQGDIVEIPMVGGLHHRYTRQAA